MTDSNMTDSKPDRGPAHFDVVAASKGEPAWSHPEDPMDQGDVEPYGERPEVEIAGSEIQHGAVLPAAQSGAPLRQSSYETIAGAGGVQAGTFSRTLGMPIEGEQGDGIEIARDDITTELEAIRAKPEDSVEIVLWTGGRRVSLQKTWEQGEPEDHAAALRTLNFVAEQLIEDDRL